MAAQSSLDLADVEWSLSRRQRDRAFSVDAGETVEGFCDTGMGTPRHIVAVLP